MLSITVRNASPKELEEWDDCIDLSIQGSIFHKIGWLKAAAKHTKTKLFYIVGCYNNKPMVLFPLFYKKIFFLNLLFSPPYGSGIPWMGPVLLDAKLPQYKKEDIQYSFIINMIDFISNDICSRIDYKRIISPRNLKDMRPYIWNDYNVTPSYSYLVSLKLDEEEIFNNFKKQERTDIRRAIKNKDLEIKKGGIDEIIIINDLVRKRYDNQGRKYRITSNYIRELYLTYPKQFESIVLEYNNKIITGLILIKNNDTLCHWVGGTPPTESVIGANALLHWMAIKAAKSNGFKFYELLGADTRHLCKFKSKFNPSLIDHYIITKTNILGKIASFMYRYI